MNRAGTTWWDIASAQGGAIRSIRFASSNSGKQFTQVPSTQRKTVRGRNTGSCVGDIAGGLDASRQFELSKRLVAYLPLGGSRKPGRRPGSHELAEIWRAVASLELIPVATKIDLGNRLVYETRSKPIPIYLFWSLARVGGRVPLYGPANLVVPPGVVEEWIDTLLWIEISEAPLLHERDFSLTQLARMSGDRGRDIDPDVRARVREHLAKTHSPSHWRDSVAEVTSLDRSEQTKLFGDALPVGLTIASSEGASP